MRQVYDNQTIANTSTEDNTTRSAHQHMGYTTVYFTTNPGWTHGLILSLDKPLPHPFYRQNKKATTHQERLHETAYTDTTDITSGHNPGTYSHASSGGPLIRRRVTIHVEDHKPPKTNRQATNTQTTPQTRLTTNFKHICSHTIL